MSRLNPKDRKQQILAAAVAVATEQRTLNVTRLDVSIRAGVSEALVSRYFNTMHQLRRSMVRYAVHEANVPITALAVMSSAYKVDISPELKDRVSAHLQSQMGG